jgi:hypothetical protein
MHGPVKTAPNTDGWKPIPDPEGRFSTGIADFDRLLGGGFERGSTAMFTLDETVGIDDLDYVLQPTYLNALYHSRGIVAVIPSRDSPHAFRQRLTRFVTRRRFDSRVRICDYVGEDKGAPYVVNLGEGRWEGTSKSRSGNAEKRALAKMVSAEKVAQGSRRKPFLELTAFEVFDTLLGSDRALQLFYYAIKRTREMGNLGIGVLGPGVGCAAGVRRMVDTEFGLHRDAMGLIIRGIRPAFSPHLVTQDLSARPPHVAFAPRPA